MPALADVESQAFGRGRSDLIGDRTGDEGGARPTQRDRVRALGVRIEAARRAQVGDADPRPSLAISGLVVIDVDRVERAELDHFLLPRLVFAPDHHAARRVLWPRDARELRDL